jgi:hypothetical protein
MRVASVLAVVILELVVARPFTVASQLSTPVARDPSGYCVSAAEHVLLTRINQVRRQDASSPPRAVAGRVQRKEWRLGPTIQDER